MIRQFVFNHFGVNCYVVYDEQSKECAIVDPSMEASYEDSMLFQFIDSERLTVKHIMLTHAHVDHICGLRQACNRYDLPVTMHRDGAKLLHQAEVYGSMMGFDTANCDDLKTLWIDEGDKLCVGDIWIECLHVPGHCPGSLCYVVRGEKSVITGDALFQGSVGRSDLPGGDHQTLISSIKAKLLTLPDDYRVLPGHGEASTIADEKIYNPFL